MRKPSLVPGDKRERRQPRQAAAAPAAAPRCQGGGRAPQPPNIPPRLPASPSTAPATPLAERAAREASPAPSGCAHRARGKAELRRSRRRNLCPDRHPLCCRRGRRTGLREGSERDERCRRRERARASTAAPLGQVRGGAAIARGGAGMEGAGPRAPPNKTLSAAAEGGPERVRPSPNGVAQRAGGREERRCSGPIGDRKRRGRRSWY